MMMNIIKKIQRKNDIIVIFIYYVLGTGAFLTEVSTEQGGKRGRQARAGLLRVDQKVVERCLSFYKILNIERFFV